MKADKTWQETSFQLFARGRRPWEGKSVVYSGKSTRLLSEGLSSFLALPLTYWVILAKPFTFLALGFFLCEMKIVGNVISQVSSRSNILMVLSRQRKQGKDDFANWPAVRQLCYPWPDYLRFMCSEHGRHSQEQIPFNQFNSDLESFSIRLCGELLYLLNYLEKNLWERLEGVLRWKLRCPWKTNAIQKMIELPKCQMSKIVPKTRVFQDHANLFMSDSVWSLILEFLKLWIFFF